MKEISPNLMYCAIVDEIEEMPKTLPYPIIPSGSKGNNETQCGKEARKAEKKLN